MLEVVYLIFNEGYAATAGDDWMRPALCEDALRLGRILAALAPAEPEAHGLVALMEIQASRTAARRGPSGEPVLLLEQDRARWDRLLDHARARRAARARRRSAARPARTPCRRPSPRVMRAPATAGQTDWARIAALYDALAQLTPSPVVELNRARGRTAMAFGPAAGLAIVDALQSDPAMASYHLLPSVRAELLASLGRRDEARAELARAAALTHNEAERDLLRERDAAYERSG